MSGTLYLGSRKVVPSKIVRSGGSSTKYKLEQTAGGYKAVPYNRNLGSELLTGFATSTASHGETFYVNTVLPPTVS